MHISFSLCLYCYYFPM